jgi:hypothetical protein
MDMRPIWAVVISVAEVVACWVLSAVVGSWTFLAILLSGLGFALLAPLTMALCLLVRRRLGRRTSSAFAAQAVVLALAGSFTWEGGSAPLGYVLGGAWLALIPVIGWLAWSVETERPAADAVMRPGLALAVSAGSVALWWGVRAAVSWPDAVGVLSHAVVLVPFAPVVLGLTLLNRRLGRLTAWGFVAQAVLWQLFGLARPTWSGSLASSLLTRPFMEPQESGFFGPPQAILWTYVPLDAAWCLVVLWVALVAWFGERAPVFVGLAAGDDQ